MERLRPSGRSGEAGFTLIELMVVLGARSASGTCFYLKDQATRGTSTAPGLSYTRDTACAAPGSTTVAGTSW